MTVQFIRIPFKPRPWQKEVANKLKKFNYVCVHRRAGKTELAVNILIKRALARPNGNFAYIAPTYTMVKDIAWDRLKKYTKCIPGAKANGSELSITFPNGSKISLKGAYDPDTIRGQGFNGVVMDETQDLPKILWDEVILPTLFGQEDWFVIILGTPKGQNLFYTMYQDALANNDGNWTCTFKTVADTGFDQTEDFRILSATMSAEKRQQEWYCDFNAGNVGAYYLSYMLAAKQEKRIAADVSYNEDFPVFTAWDIGIRDYTTIWFFQKIGGRFNFIEYLQDNNRSLEDWIKIVKTKKYQGNYGAHYAPHDMQHRDYTIGVSRHMFALAKGLNFTITPSVGIDDGIEAARLMLPYCYFNPNTCKEGVVALENYAAKVDRRTGKISDAPVHDDFSHGADSFRYAAVNMIKLPSGFSQSSLFGSKNAK